MPSTPGAEKSLRNQRRKRKYNDKKRRAYKEALKELRDAVDAGDYKAANELLPDVYKAIDKAAKRGVIHQNKADRKKSQASALIEKQA